MRFFFAIFLLPLVLCESSSTDAASSTTVTSTTKASTTTSTTTTVTPTTTSSCQDAPGENCAAYKTVCDNPIYYPLLVGKCDKTCGYCGGGTTKKIDTCVDASSKCADWNKNGFCSNGFYTCQKRKEFCAKTCGLCNTTC